MAKISYHYYFRNITISRFFVMLILLLCLSSAAKIISLLQRQILSRLQNIKSYAGNLDQSGEDKNLCHYFIVVTKNKNKDTHYKYT